MKALALSQRLLANPGAPVVLEIEGRFYAVAKVSGLIGLEPVDTIIEAVSNPLAIPGPETTAGEIDMQISENSPDGDVQLYLSLFSEICMSQGVPAYFDLAEVRAGAGATVLVAGEVRCVG